MNKAQYTLTSLFLLLLSLFACDSKADIYIKIGSGYKLIETEYLVLSDGNRIDMETGGKISARIEIGKEHGNWTYGVSHRSQWLAGYPFNDKEELEVTELFIDYKFTL